LETDVAVLGRLKNSIQCILSIGGEKATNFRNSKHKGMAQEKSHAQYVQRNELDIDNAAFVVILELPLERKYNKTRSRINTSEKDEPFK
jgi:hypothetical protein